MSPPSMTAAEAYVLAQAHHNAGRISQAASLYRQILTVAPNEPEVLHMLALTEHVQGRPGEALVLLKHSVELVPCNPRALSNLGEMHKASGDWQEAQKCYEQALALDLAYPDAHHNLGAVHLYLKRFTEAASCFERAAQLRPDHAETWYLLGVAYGHLRRYEPTLLCLERALALRPEYPEAQLDLGHVLLLLDRFADAAQHLRQAADRRPGSAPEQIALAIALLRLGRYGEAAGHAERAAVLEPGNGAAYGNLGLCQLEIGQLADALVNLRLAVRLGPDDAGIHSSLLHTLLYDPTMTDTVFRAEHELWNERHVAPLRAERRPHANDPDPARRLRVGYVSPDFRDHAMSHFIAPLFAAHNRAQVEVHAYAITQRRDAVTERLRALADYWHPVGHCSPEALAEQIRADGIDILVDLALHTENGCPLVCARRPAPVQVSWLGYAGTSGVEGIDYRLSDPCIDPPEWGADAPWSSETVVRLPDSWCCYEPRVDAPPVGPLPALGLSARGMVTFGSLNQMGKHHEGTRRLWIRILQTIPGSRLVMYNPDPVGQSLARSEFEAAGIAWERLVFAPRMSKVDCLRVYADWVDIGLDPWPHNGMTTTCEALWMGVPVVSLAGRTPVSRTGLSLLSCVGLPELVAQDEDGYVQITCQLARDLPRLDKLRAGLREQMTASPLLDRTRFANHVETAYRTMWQQWCEVQKTRL